MPESHGGRRSSVASGYRPQLYLLGDDWDAVHDYGSIEKLVPGQPTIAELTFPNPKNHIDRLFSGLPFLLREGNRTIGYGRILQVLDTELERKKDHRNEFYFSDDAVGIFATDIPPLCEGEYSYEPYRGSGHYEMQQSLSNGSSPLCHCYDGSVKIAFNIAGCPRYGVVELANVIRES
ncbi:hypothetical protein [Rubripirellula tenax]|uniref:hypothetical protein n=1 Tax=Rubripirellula tenax TaxID=2528015 RepID=UPI001647CB56